jgi:ATP-dependent helicase/nuclease subunit A
MPIDDDKLPERLSLFADSLRSLIATHPTSDKNGRIASACEDVIGTAASGQRDKLAEIPQETRDALRQEVGKTKAWAADEIRALKMAQKISRNLLLSGDRVIALLTARLKPFIAHFRSVALAKGYLSNSALLALACSLVRRQHDVRGILQRDYRVIFIDEFQDTDPRQGELLLFLAEKPGGHAKNWREVELEPGKLFVVGDPKQSIYRFRGADIGAYRQIADLMIQQGGVATPLQKSWRSHDQIIHAVNHAFSQIIQENGHISPPYVPLEPLRQREGLPLQQVELLLAHGAEPQSSEQAQQKEALEVASWIESSVGRLHCLDKKEGRRRLLHRDIALVFRSTPAMRAFVEALRDRDIPFVVEGERYFYSTPEVTDLINLLRVVENPHDRLALVGFLRSPLGGFTDAQILDLKEAKALDASLPLPGGYSAAQQATWTLLQSLHRQVGRVPLKTLLRHLFDESYVLELAARSYHHDQTIANVLKLKRLLESFAEEGVTSLRALLAKVRLFMENDRLEGESPLADESYDAVRLLTIHKAKGLEFPVVILPSLHAGRRTGQSDPVVFDWSSGRLGVRAGELQNLEKFFLDAEALEREREEEKRVLYVAMTRGRERLILSGGVNLLRPSNDSYLEWIRQAWGLNWDEIVPGPCTVGPTEIQIRLAEPPAANPARSPALKESFLDSFDPTGFADRWTRRKELGQKALRQRSIVTPSTLGSAMKDDKPEPPAVSETSDARLLPERARWLGTIVHQVLERWDFNGSMSMMREHVGQACHQFFSALGRQKVATSTEEMRALQEEAADVLTGFMNSPAYAELQRAEILGREIPFFYRAGDGEPLIRGTIDVLYKDAKGTLVVGDYKTGAMRGGASDPSAYERQGNAYRKAVEAALGTLADFKLIYLRSGSEVTA